MLMQALILKNQNLQCTKSTAWWLKSCGLGDIFICRKLPKGKLEKLVTEQDGVGDTTACWVHLRLGLGPQSLTLRKSFSSPCNSCGLLPIQSVNSVASCRPTRRGRPTHCQLESARLQALGSQRLIFPVRARWETPSVESRTLP